MAPLSAGERPAISDWARQLDAYETDWSQWPFARPRGLQRMYRAVQDAERVRYVITAPPGAGRSALACDLYERGFLSSCRRESPSSPPLVLTVGQHGDGRSWLRHPRSRWHVLGFSYYVNMALRELGDPVRRETSAGRQIRAELSRDLDSRFPLHRIPDALRKLCVNPEECPTFDEVNPDTRIFRRHEFTLYPGDVQPIIERAVSLERCRRESWEVLQRAMNQAEVLILDFPSYPAVGTDRYRRDVQMTQQLVEGGVSGRTCTVVAIVPDPPYGGLPALWDDWSVVRLALAQPSTQVRYVRRIFGLGRPFSLEAFEALAERAQGRWRYFKKSVDQALACHGGEPPSPISRAEALAAVVEAPSVGELVEGSGHRPLPVRRLVECQAIVDYLHQHGPTPQAVLADACCGGSKVRCSRALMALRSCGVPITVKWEGEGHIVAWGPQPQS